MIHLLLVCSALLWRMFYFAYENPSYSRIFDVDVYLGGQLKHLMEQLLDAKFTKNDCKKIKSGIPYYVLITRLKSSTFCSSGLLIIFFTMDLHKLEKTASSNPSLFYHLCLLLHSKSTDLWLVQSSENCEIWWKKSPCGEKRIEKVDCRKQKPEKD